MSQLYTTVGPPAKKQDYWILGKVPRTYQILLLDISCAGPKVTVFYRGSAI